MIGVAWLGLPALLTAAVAAPDSEEIGIVRAPSGAMLEWKRRPGKPAQLKVTKVAKGSQASALGYRARDEILTIGAVPVADRDLTTVLDLPATAAASACGASRKSSSCRPSSGPEGSWSPRTTG